jgi:hypothetical protein
MPSLDEMIEMYNELIAYGVGNFNKAWYFSSSERNATEAWAILRNDGSSVNLSKGSASSARPCRMFTSTMDLPLRSHGEAGGLIFYKNGTTYLEAANYDAVSLPSWSNIINVAIGTTGTGIGTGQSNTNDIIAQAGHIYSDAKSCNDLVIVYP